MEFSRLLAGLTTIDDFLPQGAPTSPALSGPLQKRVTGIVINEKPQAPIGYRRKIRQEMYYISKYGLLS